MPFTERRFNVYNKVFNEVARVGLDNISKQLFALIKSRLIYSVNITGMCRSIRYETIQDIFKNIPTRFEKERNARSYYETVVGERDHMWVDVLMYRGTPIFLVVDEMSESIMLHTAKTNKNMKNMEKFIRYLRKRGEKHEIGYHAGDYATLRGYRLDFYRNGHIRSFDDVFIPKTVESDICNAVDCFIKNKRFYEQHHLPYHLGIMLFGEPGTGKTSIISALSNRFNITPYYVKASDIWRMIEDDSNVRELLSQTNFIKMVVIEDIDTCEIVKREKTDNEKIRHDIVREISTMIDEDVPERVSTSLSDFLNLIDGCGCLENVIWVFTTNHIESIDPAVLRSGRVDHKYYIGYATDETFSKFMRHHFSRAVPDKRHVKDKVSLASVQNDIAQGYTFEQIVDKYTI